MSGEAPRVLIVRLSALGDVVHVLPALAAIRRRWPRATVDWLVEDRAASLLEAHPQLDRVHVVPRRAWTGRLRGGDLLAVLPEARSLVRALRRRRYDVALDFQANFRSGLLTWLSGAPRRVLQPPRFAKEGSSRLFATDRPRAVAPEAHKIERNLALLEPLGAGDGAVERPVLPATPAGAAMEEGFREEPGPRVLLAAGVSAFGALKAWPEERFVELARSLVGRGVGAWFTYGGAREEAQARRLAAAAGARLAPPTGSLLELVGLLRAADLFVGVDSGPLHLAAAVGTPVLGLYGPKHPETYGPYWPPHRIARSGIECSPCRYRRCPRPDAAVHATPEGPVRISPCMERLGAATALATALELIEGAGAVA